MEFSVILFYSYLDLIIIYKETADKRQNNW